MQNSQLSARLDGAHEIRKENQLGGLVLTPTAHLFGNVHLELRL